MRNPFVWFAFLVVAVCALFFVVNFAQESVNGQTPLCIIGVPNATCTTPTPTPVS